MNRFTYSISFILLSMAFLIAGWWTGCSKEPGNEKGSAATDTEGLREPSPALKKQKSGKSSQRAVRIILLNEETRKPVTGAHVALYYSAAQTPDRIQAINSVTNLDGEAIFEPGETVRLMCRSEYDLSYREFDQHPSEPTCITLYVQPQIKVSGRVVGVDGQGVEGAIVFITRYSKGQAVSEGRAPVPGSCLDINEFRRHFGYDMESEITTDKSGCFMGMVKFRKPLILTAHAPGYLSASWQAVSFSEEANAYPPIEIRLRAPAKVRIQVYDARNKPLGNRTITLCETSLSSALRSDPTDRALPLTNILTSDSDGMVETTLPAGQAFGLERFLLYPKPDEAGPFPDPIRSKPLDAVRLSPGETRELIALPPKTVRLFGTLRDRDGQPVADAKVSLLVNTFNTGADGAFSILVPYNIHKRMSYGISKKGYAFHHQTLPEIAPDSQELRLDVVLEPSRDLTVSAGPDTRAVWMIPDTWKADFHVPEGVEALPVTADLRQGQACEDHRFVFDDMAPDSYCVLAQQDCFHFTRYSPLRIKPSDPHTVHVDLKDAGFTVTADSNDETWLQGKVIMEADTAPHSVEVTIMRTDIKEIRRWDPLSTGRAGLAWSSTPAAPDGSFEFRGLAPGSYSLAATCWEWDNRIDIYGEIQAKAGANSIKLEATPAERFGNMQITLRDAQSSPLADACLLFFDPVDSMLGRAGSIHLLSCSNGDGEILLNRLPPGRYGFAIEYAGNRDYQIHARVKVLPNAVTRVNLVLNPGD
ncbi:MAG: carboxypeptidase-like regulatory domain-containing protein [Planctomycetota bacterium]